jgi:hypothetical protein
MPKAKPVSLHPLKFEDALKTLLAAPVPPKKGKPPKRKRTL